jgi:hypothetical protein
MVECPLLPKADMGCRTAHVRFRGKADMTLYGNPLLRSLLRVKRTWAVALHMSTYDPKRTRMPTTTSDMLLGHTMLVLSLGGQMRRREFIRLAVGAAAWPPVARAQSTMPTIGVLNSRAPGESSRLLEAFRQGLKERGFVEGQNVRIEYRFAHNQNGRLPELAADLAQRGRRSALRG